MDEMMPAKGAMTGQQAPEGAEICIKVGPGGDLSVYMEGGEGGESTPQPVPDIGQALKAALEMYRSLPQPGASEQEQFTAGFKGEKPEGRMY
jgi:hypothetical protein